MSPEQEREFNELKEKVTRLESILFGINNDTRFQAKIREQAFGFRASSGLPYIILRNGDRYQITNVTKLN